MRLYEKLLVMRQCAPRYGDLVKMALYEPPYTIDQIRKEYGDDVADRMSKDPVHRWRADTGIELIHREPDLKEFVRIVKNWKRMDGRMRSESDKKSKELFGKGNMERVKELMEEYASTRLNKKAQVVDHDKWPDNFQEYQKLHNDKLVWLARKAVIDDRKNRGAWGLATSDGKFLSSDDDVDNEENLKSVVIRAGKAAREARRASCHELAASILDRLRENRINARRVFVDKDRYNGVAMGHSTVFFQGQDGHWHRAANGIGSRKKSRLGDFTSLEDAIDQYIAVEKANKQTTDDERVDAYDTTDLPFTDNMPWPEYKALARTGKRIYHQEAKK